MNKRLLVIIPCYNEEKNIAKLIDSIEIQAKEFLVETDILCINDCSKDNTLDIIKTKNVLHLNLPVNLGIGGAVQSGFKFASKYKYDFAAQMDGDGQHPPSELNKLLICMEKNQADVVIGSRFIDKIGFQTSVFRRIGIIYFEKLIKFLTGKTITDSTSGYRLLNANAIKIVANQYPDDYPEPEAVMQFFKHKLKVVETPVIMEARLGGVSSIGNLKSIYYIVKVTLGILTTFWGKK